MMSSVYVFKKLVNYVCKKLYNIGPREHNRSGQWTLANNAMKNRTLKPHVWMPL